MCNLADATPRVDGTPSQDAIQTDTRSEGQRNHDALNAALCAVLCSGKLGQHNGLPASIIVTTTLKELETGCGKALTGGGSLLPMPDVIRLASHAHHYLAIFDKGRALALYHRKRIASAAQRIVLHANDRGSSHPGCDVSAYFTEVHHVIPWAKSRETNIHDCIACGSHHKLAEQGWKTRIGKDGVTAGFRHRTLITASQEPTPSITRRTAPRRRRRRRALAACASCKTSRAAAAK